MRLLGVVAAVSGALVIGAVVLGDVAVSALNAWHGAGWISLLLLGFPVFVAWGARRHGG